MEKNSFIIVHDSQNGPILVNANTIITAERTGDTETTVYLLDNNSIEVRESPERIFNLINKTTVTEEKKA